jgi:hypothetical protein
MLEFMKEFTDHYDALFFLPHDENEDQVVVHARKFTDAGESLNATSIGPSWHVVLFETDEEGLAKNIDVFDAILSEPREYISGLIPLDIYGVVARKTTTSKAFLDDFVAKISAA